MAAGPVSGAMTPILTTSSAAARPTSAEASTTPAASDLNGDPSWILSRASPDTVRYFFDGTPLGLGGKSAEQGYLVSGAAVNDEAGAFPRAGAALEALVCGLALAWWLELTEAGDIKQK